MPMYVRRLEAGGGGKMNKVKRNETAEYGQWDW